MRFVDGCDEGIVDVHLEGSVYDVVVWSFLLLRGEFDLYGVKVSQGAM